MKQGQKLWTREELILAINLYCKLPFGKLHKNNPEIIELAKYKIKISSTLKEKKSLAIKNYFLKYDNKDIFLPSRFLPDKEFLKYHYEERFKK